MFVSCATLQNSGFEVMVLHKTLKGKWIDKKIIALESGSRDSCRIVTT